jgi:hypothetical protein
MADEKEKNTHVMHVVFDNGIQVPTAWREQTREVYVPVPEGHIAPNARNFSHHEVVEGFFETPKYYEVRKADGSVERFLKERVVYYKIAPWKDLPESVKDRLITAKNTPSPRGVH